MPVLRSTAVCKPHDEEMRTPTPARLASRPRVNFARLASTLAVLAAFFALDLAGADVRANLTREYDLKAAFLFNFAQFVEWPAEAFAEASSPFVICILGEDPFGGSLEEIIAHEAIHGRKIVVRRHRNVEEISTCHILYVSASETPKVDHVLAALDGRPILTVGETDLFSTHDGIIQFRIVESRLRLRINVAAARMANLSISSQLLRQSEIVGAK